MEVELLLIPYDSARRGERMGAGPEALVAAGLPARLQQMGHRVREKTIEPPRESWRAEIRTAFELAGLVSEAVRSARAAGRFPLFLAGNCGTALGVCAGLGSGVRVLWFDAHGEFNTPETTTGGFLDGMPLATLTGRCWTNMASRIPGFRSVRDDRIWLLGARELDPLEAEALARSAIHRLPARPLEPHVLGAIAGEVREDAPLYVHFDVDVLDPSEGQANDFAVSGGLSAADLVASLGALRQRARPAALTVASYDPSADVDRRIADAAMRAVEALLPAVV